VQLGATVPPTTAAGAGLSMIVSLVTTGRSTTVSFTTSFPPQAASTSGSAAISTSLRFMGAPSAKVDDTPFTASFVPFIGE
jgi:hypothetical protein